MPRDNVQKWIDGDIPDSFADPLTGIKPRSEKELTAVLSILHQMRSIKWEKVHVKNVMKSGESLLASKIIKPTDLVGSEYPLFARTDEAINRWGGMSPDIAFMDREVSRLVVVEAKIDSHFTFSDEPPDGQVSRYLEFLKSCHIKDVTFIVLCPEFNTEWYSERVVRAIQKLDSTIPTFVMEWDAIFRAV